jgi:hypothetical protein
MLSQNVAPALFIVSRHLKEKWTTVTVRLPLIVLGVRSKAASD